MTTETTYSFSDGNLVKTEATPGELVATVMDGGQQDLMVRPLYHQVWKVGRTYYITRQWRGDADPMLCTIGDGTAGPGTTKKATAIWCAKDLQTFRDGVDEPVVTYAKLSDCPERG